MADYNDRWPVLAAGAAASKKAIDPVVLAVGDVLAITDHFVITSGSNTRQVRTIADEIERQITEAGGPKPLRTEGLDDLRWVLLDYGDFIAHVFSPASRRFYDLERLWRDAKHVALPDEIKS